MPWPMNSIMTSPIYFDESGIGTAPWLLLIETSDELEGTSKEKHLFLSESSTCVRKMIAKFPFSGNVVSDLRLLYPRNQYQISCFGDKIALTLQQRMLYWENSCCCERVAGIYITPWWSLTWMWISWAFLVMCGETAYAGWWSSVL